MVNTKYFKTACLGGYQDSSIVYQFQSSKLFRIKTILKFILPVIFLNLFYTSSFHTCEITSLNITLQRNNMHIKNVKFPCRTLKMSCTYKNALFTKHIMMSYLCFTIWMVFLILLAGDVELNQALQVLIVSRYLTTCQTLVWLTCPYLSRIFLLSIIIYKVWSANLTRYKSNYHILT